MKALLKSRNKVISASLMALVGTSALVLPLSASAQFGGLLQQLQRAIPQQPGGMPGAAPGGVPGMPGMPGQAQQRGGGADAQGLNICNVHMVATTSRQPAEVERLVLTHFNVAGEAFFNQAYAALVTSPRRSDAIPDLRMFSGSFETKRGNALFATFIAWPEPELMAEIIAETQNRRDPQVADDARAMLLLVQWAAPQLARSEDAWLKLAREMRGIKHIPTNCLWARLHATGEAGAVSPGDALGQYNQCGANPTDYRQESIPKTVDPQNYYTVTLLPDTLRVIQKRNPRAIEQMGPMARDLKSLGENMEREQAAYQQQFLASPVGRSAIAASQLVTKAEAVGAKAISSSQQMSRSYGDLQANLKQVENRQGGREGEFIPSASMQQRLALMAAAAKNADSADASALNEVRQLQGAAAVGLTRSRNAVLAEMFQTIMNGNMLGAARYTQVFLNLDAASIRSCRAYNSFQQAARARNVSTNDDDKASTSMLSDMMASSK